MGRKQAYGRPKPTLQISRSKSSGGSSRSSPAISPISSAAPKTPADEGIEFFQGEVNPGETPIQVYELALDPDGGPSKALSVCVIYSWFRSCSYCSQYVRLPPAYTPYILRVSIQAGTPAARNGVFKTNFPLDGGVFSREKFCKRKCVQEYPLSLGFLLAVQTPTTLFEAHSYRLTYIACGCVQILG